MAVDATRARVGSRRTRHGATRVVRGRRLRPGAIVRAVFILLYLGFLLLPLYWAAVTSIKPQDDLLTEPPVWWPKRSGSTTLRS